MVWITISIISVLFSTYTYNIQKKTLTDSINQKLYDSAILLKSVLPENYHDILNKDSFLEEEYDQIIVYQNNRLCKELDLQYIWSNMIVNDEIVFTTSTSPSHDIANKDHAKFFDVHNDPHAFDQVFSSMEITYAEFHNEWGHGKMVLVPFIDKNNRPYVFGASMSIDDVDSILRKTARNVVGFTIIAYLIGIIITLYITKIITDPVKTLTMGVVDFTNGESDVKIDIKLKKSKDEIGELATSFDEMISFIKASRKESEKHSKELEKRVKERTKELEKSKNQIQKQLKELKSLDILKTEFLSFTSHELKTPLTPIKAQLQRLINKDLSKKEQIQSLDIILRNTERLSRLINDILEITRIESKRMKLYKKKVNIKEFINNMIDTIKPEAKEKKIKLKSEIKGKLPEISVDIDRIQQVFLNLIENAIHHANPTEITTSANKINKNIVIEIKDNGSGISTEDKKHIFEKFYSGKEQRYFHHGTGLGLAISKGIIKAHGGKIWFRTKLKKGTSFFFSLPIYERIK